MSVKLSLKSALRFLLCRKLNMLVILNVIKRSLCI